MKMNYEAQGLLHEMFSRQAEATPDKVAIVGEDDRRLTFRDLQHQTDVLSQTLRNRGVLPDSAVCIYMEKCVDYAISYIAILKAGGAYLPLDISYPIPLIESIFSDAEPKAIVTNEDFAKNVNGYPNVIVLKKGWVGELESENNEVGDIIPHTAPLTLDNLAYIVYSSGTTGKPKGIMCPHRGAVFSYHCRHTRYPYMENDREAVNVFFTWEMLRPLIKGIPLYIIPDNIIYDPVLLCQYLKRNSITRMLSTPSLFEAILNSGDINVTDALRSMRQIFFCGEVVTTSLFQRCLKLVPWIQFINLYSISECHDVADESLNDYYQKNKDELTSRKFCPVGQLLPGVTVLILNSEFEPQPVGVSGEIAVGGPTLARGYLNRPVLNKARFINCPEVSRKQCSTKLYRTGDWGYCLSNKRLEICGRCDTMVKIRGYSIEVQAVESALMELPSVNACVVVVKGDEGEDKFLVSYIVPEGQTSKKKIRAALKQKLPFYMIPSYFVFLESIPILPASGKLDKKALPEFDKQCETNVDVEGMATTELEKDITCLWAEVLELKTVDVQESFFDLGGHSLLASVLLSKIRDKLSVELTVKDLFLYQTVYSMAKLIENRRGKQGEQLEIPPQLDLQKEVERHDQGKVNIDMQLRAFWRSFHYGDRWKKGRVLLTGATGFLGAFLLKELLLQTKAHVYCVVRKTPDIGVKDRMLLTLRQYGVIPQEGEEPTEQQADLEDKFHKTVTVIKGDVSLINLGMDDDDFTYLCTEIDFVIHAAASVNLVYPYTALQAANVRGTENTVLFACTGKIKPIHYISTDAIFPNNMKFCTEAMDVTQLHGQLEDGYAQSKWVAEQLVSRAGQRGIPVVIYRLGNMSGDQETAHWNSQDFTLLILQACARMGRAPELNWEVEMTPVDFAASVIIKLTQKLQLAIGKVFHIVNTKPVNSRWLFEWMDRHGYPQTFCSYSKWCQKVQEQPGDKSSNLLKRLLDSSLSSESYFSSLSTYDNKDFLKVLTELGLKYPSIDSQQLSKYFQGLVKLGIIPKPRKNTADFNSKPLNGVVAVVTGSSSGIGAAISIALAEAGAQVAMAARRTEQLDECRKKIEKSGGTAICVKTDVTNREEVEALVQHVECTLGPVDILVNNAGVMYYTYMKNLHKDEWEKTIDVNCKGVVNCVGAVLQKMIERNKGHIVNMSSDAGRKSFPGLAVYSGSKFFVEGFSQALRQEVCQNGIRVTCIQPGDVNTGLPAHSTDPDALAAFDGSGNSKILEPEDIARAVLFAVTQPHYVGINEILVEPREAPA